MNIRELCDTERAAHYLGVSASFLNKARLTGSGPVFLKLGAKVAYEIASLDAWLESRRRRSTSETVAAELAHGATDVLAAAVR